MSSKNREKRRVKRTQKSQERARQQERARAGQQPSQQPPGQQPGQQPPGQRSAPGPGGFAHSAPGAGEPAGGTASSAWPFGFGGWSALDRADTLVVAAIDACHRELPDLESRLHALVRFGDQFGNGEQVMNSALLNCFHRIISCQWEYGWQPADLARIVARRRGIRHTRLVADMLVSELRQYASETIDESWDAQLRALDATVWWNNDRDHLTRWGGSEGLDRLEAVRHAVETLAVIGCLPELPNLREPPGKARRGSLRPGAACGEADQRMLDRIRALLAKAESTTFAEEAEAYSAKAQELMARHSIDYALLASSGGSTDEPVGIRIGVDNPYESAKSSLLSVVATANRCRTVWSKDLGFSTVLGYPADLGSVELLYTSLLVQATTAMLQQGSQTDNHGRSRTRSFRQSFLNAYAIRIGQRLRAATEDVSQKAATESGNANLLPVLASREDEVHRTTAKMFPGMISKQISITNREGWISGTAAANVATLGACAELARG